MQTQGQTQGQKTTNSSRARYNSRPRPKAKPATKSSISGGDDLKLVALGGVGEVGRNMMFLEYKGKILIIDAGLRMPEESMPGIDYIIPNTNYLKENQKKIVGAVITHGHLDHIGAIPYMWHRIGNPRIFTGKLAKGIIAKRQEEFPNRPKLDITEITDGSKIDFGVFKVEFFRQVHNILDNFGLLIKTPVGNILHTSDFTFDKTPVNEPPTDTKRLKELAKENILLLLSDSTGAENEGHALSEQTVFENLDKIFAESKGRIIASSFASHINRVQQLIALAEKHNRKVIIAGRSLENYLGIAQEVGLVKTKKGTFIKPKDAAKLPDNQICFICTGAQGEERASLMRIATGEYRELRLKPNDSIIFSSSVIPGNERTVQILKDELYRQGAKVYHYQMMDIHSSGHAYQEELIQMIKIMRPKFFIPLHGQFSMLVKHCELAEKSGVAKGNAIPAEPGEIVHLTPQRMWLDKEKIQANYVMVDGLGIGDIGEVVLRDRQQLAQDGMFVIIAAVDRKSGKVKGSPDIISRGFVYLRESKELLQETRKRVIDIINTTTSSSGAINWSHVKDDVRNKISGFLFSRTKRRPMVLPVIIEV